MLNATSMVTLCLFALAAIPAVSAMADGAMPDVTLTGHTSPVLSMAFSPDGTRLATAADDGLLKIWDVEAKKQLYSFEGSRSNSNQVRFTPDGKTVVAQGSSNDLIVIDVAAGKVKKSIPVTNLPGGATAIDLSPDGKTIVLVGRGVLRLMDLGSGEIKAEYEVHKLYGVSGVAFSRDGKFVVTASNDKTSVVIDLAKEQSIASLPLGMNGESVLFSADAKAVIVSTNERVVSWIDVASGESRKLLNKGVPVTAMTLSADGKVLVMAGSGRAPWLATLPEGELQPQAFDSEDWIKAAALSPDNKWLAGGANGGAIYLWKMK